MFELVKNTRQLERLGILVLGDNRDFVNRRGSHGVGVCGMKTWEQGAGVWNAVFGPKW
jgi:hypothetical protein